MKTKISRLLFSAVLMMCCMVGANAQGQPPAGDGSKDNPYQITSFYQLLWFSLHVFDEDNDACAILMNDIESDGSVWAPIGYDDSHMYYGEFNGNGHVIKGLRSKNGESDFIGWSKYSSMSHKDNCLGLFGKMDGNASVHDVGVEDCYFYGSDRVGAICGDLASGEIYNCWSSGYIYVNDASGGLVGSCYINGVLGATDKPCGEGMQTLTQNCY